MKLAEINAFRIRQGLEPLTTIPGTLRPGKTARENENGKKRRHDANMAERAASNQATKRLRTGKAK